MTSATCAAESDKTYSRGIPDITPGFYGVHVISLLVVAILYPVLSERTRYCFHG